jgi:hypothetical protein
MHVPAPLPTIECLAPSFYIKLPHLKHPVHQRLHFIACWQHSNRLRGAASVIMRAAGLVTATCVAQHRSYAWEVLLALCLICVCRSPDLLLVLLAGEGLPALGALQAAAASAAQMACMVSNLNPARDIAHRMTCQTIRRYTHSV